MIKMDEVSEKHENIEYLRVLVKTSSINVLGICKRVQINEVVHQVRMLAMETW